LTRFENQISPLVPEGKLPLEGAEGIPNTPNLYRVRGVALMEHGNMMVKAP